MAADPSPFISVIIPLWNRKDLIGQALESVLSQKSCDFPWEVIVVDDGSDDGGDQVVRTFPSVRLCRIPRGGFPGRTRNRGVQAAAGRWLCFLDSDDLWLPEKLSRQAAFHDRNPEILLSHTREEWNRGGRVLSQKKFRHRRRGDLFSDSLEKCIIGPSTVMIRRDLYQESGGFREDLEIAEDYEYWLRLTARQPVGYLDEPLTVKRAGLPRQDQLSEKYGQIEIFRLQGLRDLLEGEVLPPRRREEAARTLARKARIYAAGCRKRGRLAEAEEFTLLAEQWED